jgi:hypothetical protein
MVTMPLFSHAELLLLIAAGASGIAGGFALFDAWRARRRLGAGRCSRCGQPWSSAYPDAERYLVQGREVCAPCASALRDRLPRLLRGFGLVGTAGVSWVLWELGLQPALQGYFSLARLGIGLALPLVLTAATATTLALAVRRNRDTLVASAENPALGRGSSLDH